MPEQIVIFGAGGFAREIAWLVQSCNHSTKRYELACFIDDNPNLHGSLINGVPVYSPNRIPIEFPQAKVLVAIGSPSTRQTIAKRVVDMGLATTTIIHPNVELSEFVEVEEGTLITAGNILTTNIRIGAHVHINLDCTLGHDVVLGDFTTLAPGVHVSGWVHFGERVYVGTGAVFINGTREQPLTVGSDAVIGAGACVTRSVERGVTVVGVPAKPIGSRSN